MAVGCAGLTVAGFYFHRRAYLQLPARISEHEQGKLRGAVTA
jgi:hypothetical protein